GGGIVVPLQTALGAAGAARLRRQHVPARPTGLGQVEDVLVERGRAASRRHHREKAVAALAGKAAAPKVSAEVLPLQRRPAERIVDPEPAPRQQERDSDDEPGLLADPPAGDRKSTRLNSSHVAISYA